MTKYRAAAPVVNNSAIAVLAAALHHSDAIAVLAAALHHSDAARATRGSDTR